LTRSGYETKLEIKQSGVTLSLAYFELTLFRIQGMQFAEGHFETPRIN